MDENLVPAGPIVPPQKSDNLEPAGPITPPQPTFLSTAADAAKALGSGAVSGLEGVAAIPNVLENLGLGVTERLGLSRPGEKAIFPSYQDIKSTVDKATGNALNYQPSTDVGKYIYSAGQMAPAVISAVASEGATLPSLLSKEGLGLIGKKAVTQGLIPGVTSEAAGQVAQKYMPQNAPDWVKNYGETGARIAGAILGGGLGSAAESKYLSAARPLTPSVDPALTAATRDPVSGMGAISSANLHPEDAATISKTFAQKGVSVPAAKEGIIKAATGLDQIPTALTTDVPVTPAVRNAVKASVSMGNDAIGAKLVDAFNNSAQKVKDAWSNAAQNPVTFSTGLKSVLPSEIQGSLDNIFGAGNVSLSSIRNSPQTYQFANQALDQIQNDLSQPSVSMANIAHLRSSLNSYFSRASKGDASALRAVIDGLDNWVQTSEKSGMGQSGDFVGAINNYKNAIGAERDFRNVFGQNPYSQLDTSKVAKSLRNIRQSNYSPSTLMSPQEQSQLKLLAAGHNLLNQKYSTVPFTESLGKSIAKEVGRRAIEGASGYGAYLLSGHPVLGIATGIGADLLSRIPSKFSQGIAESRALSGAPSVKLAPYGLLGYQGSLPVARASGGRVESKADRLIAAADAAKKAYNKSTEPLLNHDDDTVARALDIAQKAI